jgi:hypothetical protein
LGAVAASMCPVKGTGVINGMCADEFYNLQDRLGFDHPNNSARMSTGSSTPSRFGLIAITSSTNMKSS